MLLASQLFVSMHLLVSCRWRAAGVPRPLAISVRALRSQGSRPCFGRACFSGVDGRGRAHGSRAGVHHLACTRKVACQLVVV